MESGSLVNFLKKNKYRILLLAILVLGLTLRFYQLGKKSIWLDEAISVWLAKLSLRDALAWIINADEHPPLYYILLHVWIRLFGDSLATVRLLSALFGFGAIPFLYGAAKRLLGIRAALISAFILAISPFNIYYSQETRMYSMLLLETASAIYFLALVVTQDNTAKLSLWSWVGYTISQSAMMFTHNIGLVLYATSLNLVTLLGLLIQRIFKTKESRGGISRQGFLKRWIICQLVSLGLWLSWLPAFVNQFSRITKYFWIPFPSIKTLWGTLKYLSLGYDYALPQLASFVTIFCLLLAFYGLIRLSNIRFTILLLLCLSLGPVLGELAISIKRPIFLDKTLIGTSLPYFMMLGFGVDQFAKTVFKWQKQDTTRDLFISYLYPGMAVMFSVAVMICVGLSFMSSIGYYKYHEKENWMAAAHFVYKNADPQCIIIFNAPYCQMPFEYCFEKYKRPNEMRGVPDISSYSNRNDPWQSGSVMKRSDIPYLSKILENRREVCLVYSHQLYSDPNRVIERILDSSMVRNRREAFFGVEVEIFEAVP